MASGSVWRSAARQLPLRLTSGAFFLNSGLSKLGADEGTAQGLQQFAATTYPFLGKQDAQKFVRALAVGELAIATALLVPVVPAAVAGAALTAFSLGTIGLYLRTPGMREEGSLRPTQQGIALAKDVWLLGIGASLLADGVTEHRHHRCHRHHR
ncbi:MULTISPECIES: DoxX family membrane protein [unclassified Streptomyces]|uniref:DoxX family membrane protein n=1 Tax=unclassified Streptomyces TaxID=2593676 RepID=UPI0006924652|nr:DoxX family membrane protein [Streptomyces sp. NRRL S-241]